MSPVELKNNFNFPECYKEKLFKARVIQASILAFYPVNYITDPF